jgi:hypothetical protein
MCKERLRGVEKQCPKCKTDVSLLVDYVQNLREGLVQAQAYTRQGELGEAVWAYLEVLEVDPDNSEARRQVGKVVTAVRQFDQTAPGRKFLKRLRKETRFRRWLANANEGGELTRWLNGVLMFLLVIGALFLGYLLGVNQHATGKSSSAADKEAAGAAP